MSQPKESVKPRRSGVRAPVIQDPAKLRYQRVKARLSPIALAGRLGISRGHLSEIEKIPPTRSASPELLGRIADELGCDITALMADDEPNGSEAA